MFLGTIISMTSKYTPSIREVAICYLNSVGLIMFEKYSTRVVMGKGSFFHELNVSLGKRDRICSVFISNNILMLPAIQHVPIDNNKCILLLR